MNFENKNIIVTGGSKGIGEAITKQLLKEKAKVIVFDLEKPKFNVEFFKVDIKDEKQIKNAINKINKIDALVNNAGVYLQKSIEKTTKEELDNIIDTNIKGTYLMCKHCLPSIIKNKGNIVNISSGLGVVPEPESPAYCTTKAALIMLTKCMAQEYASKNVRVNAVLPGPIDTPLLRSAFKSQKDIENYKKLNPMKTIGKAEDVANVTLFLLSDKAKFVTGGLYSVDGGESTSSIYSK